ncbi:hypothetical protein WHR41_02378 [Cladosporium halotolerans]|uniref:Major facilitator superfamily (MFS) profile domain-containing protein n=1 Tax=Cladosporium halotolerans TaxID=1052096 RepID=A0AB34KUM8_9PEZI
MPELHPSSSSSDDEKLAGDDKHHSPPTAPSPSPSPSRPDPTAIAASHNLSEKKLLRKLDAHLIPGVTTLYLLSFLDRSNVANARLEGLEADLGLSGADYLNGLTLFFVGYILLEVLWNVILKRVGPRVWLPLVTLVWGVVATCQGAVVDGGAASGRAGFLAVRFFLGLTEGGLFPGVVFYLSMWYKRSERQYRIALFFSAASMAGAFGGILAWGIGHMRGIGGLSGWRWIFIIEGLLTIVLAFAAWWYVMDWPSKATFVTPEEKELVFARLEADSDAVADESVSWHNVAAAMKDPKVWLYGACFHTLSLPLYTLSMFLPSIIASLGYTAASAQLLTIPPYALATLLTILLATISQRTARRAPFILASTTLAIAGYIILLSNPSPTLNPRLSYAGVFLAAAGIYPSVALALAWPAVNVSGQTKRATASALQITVGNLGAVIGTQLYRPGDAPRYAVGHAVALGYLVGGLGVVGAIWGVHARINRRRDEREEREGRGYEGVWLGDEDPRWRFGL